MPVYADPLDGLAVPVPLLRTWTARLVEAVGTPPDIAADVAEILVASDRRGIASHDFSTGGNWQRITVSCGAATIGLLPPGEEEAGLMNRREYTGNLLREAYHALEAGRSAGTNRTSVGAFRS